jgi:hypothetical protein
VDEKSREIFKKIAPPEEMEDFLQDIKVLGKRELHLILKYRYKYLQTINKEKKKNQQQEDEL